MSLLLWACAAMALVCATLTLWNLVLLPRIAAKKSTGGATDPHLVSVLIPARNEAENIGPAIEAVLASSHADLELLVLDDHSTDETAQIVNDFCDRDARVRLIAGTALPRGWQGKVYACHQLAEAARGEVLVFVDADVRLAPAAVAALTAELDDSHAALVSGIPHQVTQALAEKLIVPLMHFVLYGYLPMALMRKSVDPSLGAACGQLIAVKRSAYRAVGGHAAITRSVHDGIALARQFRARGFPTDLLDADDLAQCHMYHSWSQVLEGFSKNAHEGLGSPQGLVPWTLILLLGQTFPVIALPWAVGSPGLLLPASIGVIAAYATRIALARRFRHDPVSVILHPIGVLLLVAIQWYALGRRILRLPLTWKQRSVSV